MRNVNSRSYDRALFSVHKASEGGRSFKDTKMFLEDNGVTDVRYDYSIYVGQYGLTVPKKFEKKTSRLLFGKF